MNVFEMVAFIVAIGVVGKIAVHAIKSRSKIASKENNQQTEERIDKLEERIKVLERIITSDRYDLNQQFKNLDE